jgi:hypothetical protein
MLFTEYFAMHSNVSYLFQSTNRTQLPVQNVINLELELLTCVREALLQLRQEQRTTKWLALRK